MKTFLVKNTGGGDHPRQLNVSAAKTANIKGGNTMKKFLSLLLSFALTLTLAASAFADASTTATPEPTATVEPVVTTAPTATLETTATPEPVITPEPTEAPLYSGASDLSVWEVYNLPLLGHKEKGAIEYLDGRWARARRAKNGDYLTWSIDKMFQGERQLTEGEAITQIESDVVDFNLTSDLYGSVSFRLDPEALTVVQEGQKKTPYELALDGNDKGILAAFVSLNEAYRGTAVLVEYIDQNNEVFGSFELTLHRLALRGGPTVDDTSTSWVGNFGFGYLDPSKDDRDAENSYVELPPSFGYVVRLSGNLAAVDWINVGVLLPENTSYDGWSGENQPATSEPTPEPTITVEPTATPEEPEPTPETVG